MWFATWWSSCLGLNVLNCQRLVPKAGHLVWQVANGMSENKLYHVVHYQTSLILYASKKFPTISHLAWFDPSIAWRVRVASKLPKYLEKRIRFQHFTAGWRLESHLWSMISSAQPQALKTLTCKLTYIVAYYDGSYSSLHSFIVTLYSQISARFSKILLAILGNVLLPITWLIISLIAVICLLVFTLQVLPDS